MRFGQKLAYVAVGALLVVVGQLLSSFTTRAMAQGDKKPSAEYDMLTVRSLKVVDAAGRVRARIEVTKRPSLAPVEDMIQVFNATGASVYRVGSDKNGGDVIVAGNDEGVRATMGTMPLGGSVVGVFSNNGEERAAMGVASEGGYVSVRGNDEKPRVAIAVTPSGGGVSVQGNDGKSRVVMGVNEYGHGSVSTWGPNGYQTGKLP